MLLQARTLGQLTGSVESRYLDTYSGILALEADKATVARLTLRTGGQAGAAEARRPPTRPSRDKREAAEERKKPPMKTMSSGSLLKEYRVEKQRPATPSVPEEAEVSDDSIDTTIAMVLLVMMIVPRDQLESDEHQAALLLQKTLRGRAVQLRLGKGRARKQDLIAAMMLDTPVTEQDAEQVRIRIVTLSISC